MLRTGMISRYGGDYTPPVGFPTLTGLWARFKAQDEGAHSDGDVWVPQDVSGNGNHMTQATGSKKALIKDARVNGKATFLHDGVDDEYSLPDMSAFTALTIFVVKKIANDPPLSAAKGGLWKVGGGSAGDTFVPYIDGVIYEDAGVSLTRYTVANPATAMTNFHSYCVRSATNDWKAFVNGVQIGSTQTSNTVGCPFAPKMGSALSGTVFLDGEWAELVVCSAALSAGELSDLNAYATAEYGI